jgi:hypothetical protein
MSGSRLPLCRLIQVLDFLPHHRLEEPLLENVNRRHVQEAWGGWLGGLVVVVVFIIGCLRVQLVPALHIACRLLFALKEREVIQRIQ